jgi:hypothetical protein
VENPIEVPSLNAFIPTGLGHSPACTRPAIAGNRYFKLKAISARIYGYEGHGRVLRGRKADQRPVRFRLDEHQYVVTEVLDSWQGTEHVFFKVRADDGCIYILRHTTTVLTGIGTLFRSGSPSRYSLAFGRAASYRAPSEPQFR